MFLTSLNCSFSFKNNLRSIGKENCYKSFDFKWQHYTNITILEDQQILISDKIVCFVCCKAFYAFFIYFIKTQIS